MQKQKVISAKKNFTNVSNFKRRKLIEMVYINNYSVLESAKILDINYSTAKGILRIFRKEKRIHKIKGSLEDNIEKSLSVKNLDKNNFDNSDVENNNNNNLNENSCEYKSSRDVVIKFHKQKINTHHKLDLISPLNELLYFKNLLDNIIIQQKQDVLDLISINITLKNIFLVSFSNSSISNI
jgi:hypothetical protein